MSHIEKEKLIKADILSIENRVRHAFYQGYDLGFKDGKERVKPQELSSDNVVSRDVVKEQMIMYGFHAPDMTVTEFVEDLPPVNLKEPTTKNDLAVEYITKQAAIDCLDYTDGELPITKIINLPSVTPQEPKCKDCKWWKDSDGEYRRGCGAESKCPINRREVFEGNGYCYIFEKAESEDNNADKEM